MAHKSEPAVNRWHVPRRDVTCSILCVFTAGTVRAPCGHRTGTVRAPCGHCVSTTASRMGGYGMCLGGPCVDGIRCVLCRALRWPLEFHIRNSDDHFDRRPLRQKTHSDQGRLMGAWALTYQTNALTHGRFGREALRPRAADILIFQPSTQEM